MIGLILKTLNSVPIVSFKNIVDLKQYLMSNYPDLNEATLQQFVVEFISNTIDSCLIYFSPEYRQPLRQQVLDNARKINVFEVYASDILKAGLLLGSQYPAFQQEIANWVGEFQVENIDKKNVVDFILNHFPLQEKSGLMTEKVLTSEPASDSKQFFQVEPDEQTVLIKLNNDQKKLINDETALTKLYNPYSDQEKDEDEKLELSALTGVFGNLFGALFVWLKKWKKPVGRRLRRLSQNRNICIAAVLMLCLLIGVRITKTNAKEGLAATGKLTMTAPLHEKIAKTKTVDFPIAADAEQSQATQRRLGSRKITPILDSQNTIIVGYVKEKKAAGIVEVPVRRYFERKMRIKASAYDLSLASCGKESSHPQYGMTRTGTRARRGRTIAVDPRVIPLGRKVYIVFPKKYSHMNGIYVAEDTGKKIKGYRIDVFWGEDGEDQKQIRREARAFGHRKVEIYLLQD